MKAPKKKIAFPLQHQVLNEKLKTGGNEVQINNNNNSSSQNNAKKERRGRRRRSTKHLTATIYTHRKWMAGSRTVNVLYRVQMYARSKRFNEMCEHLECVCVGRLCALVHSLKA